LVGAEGVAGDFAVADGDRMERKEVKQDAIWKSLVWLGKRMEQGLWQGAGKMLVWLGRWLGQGLWQGLA